MVDCKCGSKPSEPEKVQGLKSGYIVNCSNAECPAKSQRIGKQSCIEAWDELSTQE